jgi:hypothetical protein
MPNHAESATLLFQPPRRNARLPGGPHEHRDQNGRRRQHRIDVQPAGFEVSSAGGSLWGGGRIERRAWPGARLRPATVYPLRCFDLILHAVALPVDDHGFGVVQEPVQHGAGQGAVVVEDFGPVFIGLVGRDDGRTGSYRWLKTWKSKSAPILSIGKYPSSSIKTRWVDVFLEFGFEAVGGLGRRQVLTMSMAVVNSTV